MKKVALDLIVFLWFHSAVWAGPFDFYGSAALPVPLPDLTSWKEAGLDSSAGQQGFKVFRWDYLKDAPANAQGAMEEDLPTLKVFASPGEYEPVSFCVYAGNRELKKLTMTCSELKGPGGLIPSNCSDLRVIRRVAVREKEPNTFQLLPVCLERHTSVEVAPGRAAWVWIDLAVPADARPGRYYGTLRIADGAQTLKEVEILLRVLDIKLVPPGKTYGMFVDGSPFSSARGGITCPEKNLVKAFRAHNAFGFNSTMACGAYPVLSIKNGKLQVDLAELIKFITIYQEAGLQGPVTIDVRQISWQAEDLGRKLDALNARQEVVSAELATVLREPKEWDKDYKFSVAGDDLFKQAIQKILAEGKRRNWPEIMFFPEEELTHGGNKYYGFFHYMKVLHEIPGVRVVLVDNSTCDGVDLGNKFAHFVDVRAYNFANDAVVKDARQAGDLFWLYNYGWTRASFGLATWRLAADGNFQWADQWPWDHPYQHLQNKYDSWFIFYPAPDGVLPSPAGIRIREGMDDMRYIATLEAAIGAAEKNGVSVRKLEQARQVLRELHAEIPGEYSAFCEYAGQLTQRQMLVMRWNIARAILMLSGKATKE
ncbi:MAG: glycoside hydrolase domain-containing protein [bacterium]